MIDATPTDAFSEFPGPWPQTPGSVEQPNPPRLGQLLARLQSPDPKPGLEVADQNGARFDNHLAMVRLGVATSLFYALRVKHAPTAAHSLRVAIACSAWAEHLGVESVQRDQIEVAALLHDVGKIGIPDRILRKPGRLSDDEQLKMDTCPDLGCEILVGCTDDEQLLNIVRHSNFWFQSRRQNEHPRGDDLPLGARMLAVADAFDAMTTDHVYRPAMSRELAITELVRGSGTQFDPELVCDYRCLLDHRPDVLQGRVADRWLQQLQPSVVDALWRRVGLGSAAEPERVRRERLFFSQLTDTLHDGIAFTDNEGTITRWNATLERLTSINADAVLGQTWQSSALKLRATDGSPVCGRCPIAESLRLGTVVSRTMMIAVSGKDPIPVQVHVSPVTGEVPGTHGAVVVVRDLSAQTDLEQQLETLTERATRDGLTGVANRAELDLKLENLVDLTAAGGETFSLIICDVDHFKWVNDTHGHPAGDQALVSFASILRRHSREGDLVARYGGEEFVVLAANCDNATATRRAESIRQAVENTPLAGLNGEAVTVSFGVTEFQTGDSVETILARADRALLKAKDQGRNRVVQLGRGKQQSALESVSRGRWWKWFDGGKSGRDRHIDILSSAPIDLVIEKLRGFISDHHAEIVEVGENQVTIHITSSGRGAGGRSADHQVMFRVRLALSELLEPDRESESNSAATRTKVHVTLQSVRNRDRRSREWNLCIDQVVASLRSYLMGEVVQDAAEG